MLPIVTPSEMRSIDAMAAEPVEVLIERAGAAVARAAVRMLGGTYGKRIVVIAGKGNNGADGRVAARRLTERGASVCVIEADAAPATLPPCDLLIDAAYGTGFRGSWQAPAPGRARVLAVDIPSGVDGLTGAAAPEVLYAERTVTFAALKSGLLFPPGSMHAGTVDVVDIGLDTSMVRTHLVQQADVANWLVPRESDAHKWRAAVWVIAGSGGMLGAARLAAAAAQRSGAGMVWLSSPGAVDPFAPTEAVSKPLSSHGWAPEVLGASSRFHSIVVGPGMGRADQTCQQIRDLVTQTPLPVVVDGDGLFALAWSNDGAAPLLRARVMPTVITPHDGEYALITGSRVGADRIAAARDLAEATSAVVLLKGPATVIAEPSGGAFVVTAGDERLATAGTGDVLAGIIGALIAQGVPAFEAAAAGAWIHGEAAAIGPARGLVSGDLPNLIPAVLERL